MVRTGNRRTRAMADSGPTDHDDLRRFRRRRNAVAAAPFETSAAGPTGRGHSHSGIKSNQPYRRPRAGSTTHRRTDPTADPHSAAIAAALQTCATGGGTDGRAQSGSD